MGRDRVPDRDRVKMTIRDISIIVKIWRGLEKRHHQRNSKFGQDNIAVTQFSNRASDGKVQIIALNDGVEGEGLENYEYKVQRGSGNTKMSFWGNYVGSGWALCTQSGDKKVINVMADTCYCWCIPIWMIRGWYVFKNTFWFGPRPSFSRDTPGDCSPIPKANTIWNSDVKDDI